HAINEWGLSFQPLFQHIGSFFHGRFPSNISVFLMIATGPLLISVCMNIGFSGWRFHLIHQSNECPNAKIILHTVTSAIGSAETPQPILYLNQQRKTVIHVTCLNNLSCYRCLGHNCQ
ncbi:hypothetical protein BT96DRAFT_823479, partial [Gymnopus androsaceus JB14]